jgi:hypothetical protein
MLPSRPPFPEFYFESVKCHHHNASRLYRGGVPPEGNGLSASELISESGLPSVINLDQTSLNLSVSFLPLHTFIPEAIKCSQVKTKQKRLPFPPPYSQYSISHY